MNNLRKFSTEADYAAATLSYPSVAWVTATDVVHFDKTDPTPTPTNTKVKLAFTTDACCEGKEINLAPNMDVVSNINSITVNGEPFTPGGSDAKLMVSVNSNYLIEYELKDGVSNVGEWFNIIAVEGCSSTRVKYDILFPAQVTYFNTNQDYAANYILESTTPPSADMSSCDFSSTIYVPDSAVNTYKTVLSEFSDYIQPVSEYSGKIPLN
jgi:hypothetical protein